MILLTGGIVLLLASVAFVAYDVIAFRRSLVRDLSTLAELTARISGPVLRFDSETKARENLENLSVSEQVVAACFYDLERGILASYPSNLTVLDFPSKAPKEMEEFMGNRLVVARNVVEDGEWLGVVYLESSLADMYSRIRRFSAGVTVILVGAFIVVLILSSKFRLINLSLVESEGRAQAATREKNLYLANLSHEIRTPMNAILGFSQVLRRDPELTSSQRKAVETIERSGDHLLGVINDVLDLSKIEAGHMELHPEDFDLAALIHGLSSMFHMRCEQKKIDWKVKGVDTGPMPVHGDGAKLRQILINLLGNAVKFTDEGSISLQVTLLSKSPTDREIQSSIPNYHYRFEVKDSGIGLTAEAKRVLFEPFQQAEEGLRKGGSGLGLSIATRQLSLMGSSLEVESKPGKGARFYFEIELAGAQHETEFIKLSRLAGQARLAEGCGVDALVADDVEENREVLSLILSGIGCSVRSVSNGLEAVESIRRSKPDIAFLDIRMPELDGLETIRCIQAEFASDPMKIVSLSASVLAHQQKQYLEAGFDDFIPKPFKYERICECLTELLDVELKFDHFRDSAEIGAGVFNFDEIQIPNALLERLRTAVELYRSTELRRCLNEMTRLGREGARLAEYLRMLNEQGKMQDILNILNRMNSLGD